MNLLKKVIVIDPSGLVEKADNDDRINEME